MPGEASGDARLPSAGGDFEACLFAQTSFCLARPIRSIDKELIETVATLTRRREARIGTDRLLRSPFLRYDNVELEIHPDCLKPDAKSQWREPELLRSQRQRMRDIAPDVDKVKTDFCYDVAVSGDAR